MKKRNKGSNVHGYNNEDIIVEHLNNKRFFELNNNLKKFMKFIGDNHNINLQKDSLIKAKKEFDSKLKQDFYVTIDTITVYVSCKMGTGNSIHQEKVLDFNKYIKENLNASEEICNEFSFFIWADGTLDGTLPIEKDEKGNIKGRFTSREYRKKFPERRIKILNFLKKNERALIERFLFVGRHQSRVDYIYHGTAKKGVWTSKSKILDFLIENSDLQKERKNSTFPIGRMTIQAWNISQKGTNENKRGEIQVKYSSMKEDFSKMLNLTNKDLGQTYVYLGEKMEFDIAREYNKNNQLEKWKPLEQIVAETSSTYMVKVSFQQESSLNEKKVSTKSDVYLIDSDIPHSKLLEKEFILTEKDLNEFEHVKIPRSGISIKRDGSKNYTIHKFTKDSFCKAFKSYIKRPDILFLGNLLYVDLKQLGKNKKIMEDLNINEISLLNYFFEKKDKMLQLTLIEYKKIKKRANDITKDLIINNEALANAIFKGEGWFEEPYVANFIYANHELKENKIRNFAVTTGSGRSKGNYTVIIKPL